MLTNLLYHIVFGSMIFIIFGCLLIDFKNDGSLSERFLWKKLKFEKALNIFSHLILGVLTYHPARKFVMDFIRMIVVDSLSMPQSSKSPPAIDLILEVPKLSVSLYIQ